MNHLRSSALLVTACCVLTLGGCSGMYFYDAELDALAKNARLAFDDAKLTDLVAEQRTAQAAILERELAVVRRQYASQRDALLLSILLDEDVDTSWSVLIGRIREFQKELWDDTNAPPPLADATTAVTLSNNRANLVDEKRDKETGKDSIDNMFDEFITYRDKLTAKSETLIRAVDAVQVQADAAGVPIDAMKLPDQGVEDAIMHSNDGILFGLYEHYQAAELAYREDLEAFEAIKPGGVLGKLMEEEAQANASIAVGQELVKIRKINYDKAADALKQKIELGQPIDLGNEVASLLKKLEEVDAPLSSVSNAVKAADGIGLDVSSVEAKVDVLKTKLGYLRGILESTEDPEKAPTDDAKFVTAIVGGLVRSSIEAINAAQAPRTSALLLEAEHLRIQLEDANRRLVNARARQTLILDQIKLATRQLGLLDRALKAAETAETAAKDADASAAEAAAKAAEIAAAIAAADPNDKAAADAAKIAAEAAAKAADGTHSVRAVLMISTPYATENAARSLLLLSESWVAGEIPRAEARWRDIALRHDSALDASETALAAWNNLIGSPLEQLVAVHSAGITSEQIAALINAAGFTAVSISVD